MGHKILVVDDEFGVAEVLDDILTDQGYEVATATNGRQALERIAQRVPDVMFLDFMMPVLDGAGVLRAMQSDASLGRVQVILMSSLPEQTVAAQAIHYAAFIRKPFRIATVLTTLDQVLNAEPDKT